jgi:hypothetical protein
MSDISNPIGQTMKEIINDQINDSGIINMIKELDSLIDSAVMDINIIPRCKVDLVDAHETDGRVRKSLKQGA